MPSQINGVKSQCQAGTPRPPSLLSLQQQSGRMEGGGQREKRGGACLKPSPRLQGSVGSTVGSECADTVSTPDMRA